MQGSQYKGPHLPVNPKSEGTPWKHYPRERLPKSNLLTSLKWWVSVLLAIFACIQITRGIITALYGTVKNETVFPDLYEASVLELQAGLDAGHFSSVDLVKVPTDPFFLADSLYLNGLNIPDIFCTNRGSQSSRTRASRSLGTEPICIETGCCFG